MDTVDRFFNGHKRAGFLLIIFLAELLTIILALRSELLFTSAPGFSEPFDHHKYIYMAQHPFDFFVAPFCWRIGLPLLAGILPFALQSSFLAITFLSVVFSGVLLFYLLHRLGFDYSYALCGSLLYYAAGWIVRFALVGFWMPNGLIFLILLGCLYLIVSGHDIGFMILLTLGVLVKESALFIAPLFYTFRCKRIIDWPCALRTGLLALPAVLLLVLLRFVILPAQNDNIQYISSLSPLLTQVQLGNSEYNYLSLLKSVALFRLTHLSPRSLMDLSIYPFGALLCLLPFLSIRNNLKWLARLWPYLILVYTQLLFAVSTITLLYLALPVLIILALTGLKEITSRFSIPAAWVFALPAATFLLNLTKIDDNADFKWLALVLIFWLGLAYGLSRMARRAPAKDAV